MKRIRTVADLDGGEIVRLDAGTYRITHRMHGGERWAILLDDELRESRARIWIAPQTRVLEVLRDRSWYLGGGPGEETDPLLARAR